jgi:glycosyltransferase involved in cell wall biosynthesis
VIIPVYNVEKYLAGCVQSIQQQEFKDIEILLVDDGSSDQCPQLCDALAAQDSRIKVIHKLNGGASDARNVGVKQAIGDYILFVDSDDYWEGTTGLSVIHSKIQTSQADVVIYGTQDFFESSQTKVVTRGNYPHWSANDTKADRLLSLIKTHNFPGAAWIMATRRSLLHENKIEFKLGIKAEDIDWIINVLVQASSVETCATNFYMYRKNRPGSVTTTADFKNVDGILYAIERWQSRLEKSEFAEKQALLNYLGSQYLTAFVSFAQLPKIQQNELLKRMQKAKTIVNYDSSMRTKVAKICIAVIGIRSFASLVHRLYNWRKSN